MKTQIALDYFELNEALTLARRVVKVGADYLEIGSPLVSGKGLSAVTKIKREYPEHRIVLDFKTMDGGGIFAKRRRRPERTLKRLSSGRSIHGRYAVVNSTGLTC